VIDIPCEIWIPAARPDVIHAGNVARLQAKLVAEGANIPCTAEAEEALAARGILVLPDFIVNAGGVICAAVEYRGGTQTTALALIDEKIRTNTAAMV
jgi:glutamate dehydrogenase (NAD(P)+)